MEKKKLKKLVLKKDVISKLGNTEMNRMRGGQNTAPSGCGCPHSLNPHDYACFGGGGSDASCQAVESCVPMQCYDGGYNTIAYSQCNCW
jgi:natural product precursor